MTIAASQVMKLREATGLGMMTCKKALSEAEGDMQKAVDKLRKQGQATAAKRAGKSAREGKVTVLSKESDAVIYEVNSETDFVARNEDFLSFTQSLGELLLAEKPADMEAALSLTSTAFSGRSVQDKITELIGKIGEKISFRRFKTASADISRERLFSYVHGNGRIGVLLALSTDKSSALAAQSVSELGRDMAMQIAALSPVAVDRASIPGELIAKEREIYLSQAQNSGKSEKFWEKIVEGKTNKFYRQAVMLEQEFIKDTDMTVSDRIHQVEKETEARITILSFVRFALGEGED